MSDLNINAEVNKVIGEEVSKKILGTLSDEKLTKMAEDSLRDLLYTDKSFYSNQKQSKLDKLVGEKISNAIDTKVGELMNNEEYKQKIETIAKEMIDDIILRAKEKFPEAIVERLLGWTMFPMSVSIRPMIEQIMHESLSR
jgi:hypothetical protein